MNLTEKRKQFEAKRERLAAIFKQMGDERNMDNVTLIDGNPDEKAAQIDRMSTELTELDKDLKRAAQLEALDALNKKRFDVKDVHVERIELSEEHDPYSGDIKNFGEFVQMVVNDRGRLKDMGLQTGEGGGFAVPDQFNQKILAVPPMASIIRPRAQVIPPGDPADAKLEIPALRQGADGLYGGVSFTSVMEGTGGKSNDPKLDLVVLEPHRLSGYVIVGNSLLRNAGAMSSFIETLFRNAKAGYEDKQFISGAGGVLPLGILNSGAKVNVARSTAGSFTFADVVNMLAKVYGDNLVWLINRSALPKVVGMTDTAGNSIYIAGDISKGVPASLAGFPVAYNFRQPALGNEGDIMLVDPSYYLIKDGSGPYIQASEHVKFAEDQTVIKMTWFVDGQSWVKAPLLMEDGVSQVSPIVVLK